MSQVFSNYLQSDHDSLSTEQLTLTHFNHLKLMLEKSKSIEGELAKTNIDLNNESACAQLGILSCSQGGGKNPVLLAKGIKDLIGDSASSYSLWCCIRTGGDTWTVCRAENSDSESINFNNNFNDESIYENNPLFGSIRSKTFDEVVRTISQGSACVLSELLNDTDISDILTQGTGAEFNRKSNYNDHHRNHQLVLISVYSRCVWLLVGDSFSLQNATDSMISIFPVLETASQLAMAALVQYLEHQQLVSDSLAGNVMKELCPILFGPIPSSLQSNINDSSYQLSLVPKILEQMIPGSSCEIFITTGYNSSNSLPNNNSNLSSPSYQHSPKIHLSNNQSNSRYHKVTVLAVSNLDVTSIQFWDNSPIPSILISSISQQRAIMCNDIHNENPNIHRQIDCGGENIQAVIAAPLWINTTSNMANDCGFLFRFKDKSVSSTDIRCVKSLAELVGPLLQSWFQNTKMEALGILSSSPKQEDLNNSSLLSPITTKINNYNEENEENISPLISQEMQLYGNILEKGLQGISSDSLRMKSLSKYLECDWAFVINSSNKIEEVNNLNLINNASFKRSFSLNEVNGIFFRFLNNLFHNASYSNGGNKIDLVDGVDAQASGLLQMLQMDNKQEEIFSSIPSQHLHILGFNLSENHSDGSISTTTIVAGRHWQKFSSSGALASVLKIQHIVDAAMECRDLRSLFEIANALKEKVNKFEKEKSCEDCLLKFERQLLTISDDISINNKNINIRNRVSEAIHIFTSDVYAVKDIIGQSCQIETTISIYQNAPIIGDQFWLLDSEGEWKLNTNIKNKNLKYQPIILYAEKEYGTDIDSLRLELNFELIPNEITRDSKIIDFTFGDVLCNGAKRIVSSFIRKHLSSFFGSSLEKYEIHLENSEIKKSGQLFECEMNKNNAATNVGSNALENLILKGYPLQCFNASDTFIKGLNNIIPQFLLFPVACIESDSNFSQDDKLTSEQCSKAYIVSLCKDGYKSKSSSGPLPPRISDEIIKSATRKIENRQGSELHLLTDLGALYNHLADSGLAGNSNQKSFALLYTHSFVGIRGCHNVQFLALSRCDLLVTTTHLHQLHRLLDCALLPMTMERIMQPLFLTFDCADVMLQNCLESFLIKTEKLDSKSDMKKHNIDQNYISSPLSPMLNNSPSKYKNIFSGGKNGGISPLINNYQQDDDQIQNEVAGTDGFIEEAFNLVGGHLNEGSEIKLARGACESTLSKLIDFCSQILGNSCKASFGFVIQEDFLSSIYQNIEEIDDIIVDDEYDKEKLLSFCFTPGCKEDSDVRINVEQQKYEVGDENKTVFAHVNILDSSEVNKMIRGGNKHIFKETYPSISHLKVISLIIEVSASVFSLKQSFNRVTIANAMFWVNDDQIINNSGKINRVNFGLERTLLRIGHTYGSIVKSVFGVTAGASLTLCSVRGHLIDEKAQSLAYKAVLKSIEQIVTIPFDSALTTPSSRENAQRNISDEVNRLGYLDAESSKVLSCVQYAIVRWIETSDKLQGALSRVTEMHRMLIAHQQQSSSLSDFVLSIKYLSSNFSPNLNDCCVEINPSTPKDILSNEHLKHVFHSVAVNCLSLGSSINMICDSRRHEELTEQIRRIFSSILRNKSHVDDSWLVKANEFRRNMFSIDSHDDKIEALLDETLVISWCLNKQDIETKNNIRGVKSWDMMRRAISTANTVIVESSTVSKLSLPTSPAKDDSSMVSYVPVKIVSKGSNIVSSILQYTTLGSNDPDPSLHLILNQLLSCMGNRLLETGFYNENENVDIENTLCTDLSNRVVNLLAEGENLISKALINNQNVTEMEAYNLVAKECGQFLSAAIHGDCSLLLPVKDEITGLTHYEGATTSWQNGCMSDLGISIVSEKQVSALHSNKSSNVPILNILNSILSVNNSSNNTPRYILSLSFEVKITNGVTTKLKTAFLIAETLIRPTSADEYALLAVVSMFSSVISQYCTKYLIQDINIRLENQQEKLQDSKKYSAIKNFSNMISKSQTIFDIETLVKKSLAILVGGHEANLIRVRPNIVALQGASIRDIDTYNSASCSDEVLASECLTSNKVILRPMSENVHNYIASAFVPVAIVSKKEGDFDEWYTDCDDCWVLQIYFKSESEWKIFSLASTNYRVTESNIITEENHLEKYSTKDIAITAAKDIRQWIRLYRQKIVAESRSSSLRNLGLTCRQASDGLRTLCINQRDGFIADLDCLAVSLAHIFATTEQSTLGSDKCIITDARFHWLSQMNRSLSTNTQVSSKLQNFEPAIYGDDGKNWVSCDIISNITTSKYSEDQLVESVESKNEGNLLPLSVILNLRSWKKRMSPTSSQFLHKVVDDSAEIIFENRKIWLSVGIPNQRAVLELTLSDKLVNMGCEESLHTFGLIREVVKQSITGLTKSHKDYLTLTTSECSGKVMRRQLRVLGRSLSELCAEGNGQHSVLSLCMAVQAVLVRLPGVHSVWMNCSDTSNKSIVYARHCTASVQTKTLGKDFGEGDDDNNMFSGGVTKKRGNKSDKKTIVVNGSSNGLAWDVDTGTRSSTGVGVVWGTEPPIREGIDFNLDCFEISGKLVIYNMTSDELQTAAGLTPSSVNNNDDIKEKSAVFESYKNQEQINASILWIILNSELYRQTERSILLTLARAISRRVYELHKGHRNKQFMIEKKAEAALHRSKLIESQEMINQLEVTKALLNNQIDVSHKEVNEKNELLREEKEAAASAIRKHEESQLAMQIILSEMKNEVAKKEKLLQRSLATIQNERKVSEERREGLNGELSRALEGERIAEEARKKASSELSSLEQQQRKQISASEAVIKSLRTELNQALDRETSASGAGDAKLRVLLARLAASEEELITSRTSIALLRRELEASVLSINSRELKASTKIADAESEKIMTASQLNSTLTRLSQSEAELRTVTSQLDREKQKGIRLSERLRSLELELSAVASAAAISIRNS